MLTRKQLECLENSRITYVPCSHCDGGSCIDKVILNKETLDLMIKHLLELSSALKFVYQEEDFTSTGLFAKSKYDLYGIKEE